MTIFTTITRRLQTLAHCIENPSIFILRQHGGNINTFISLNQPWFHALNIATVLDIGANVGQFAITINAVIPKAQIYSFEPLPDCFERLELRMAGVKNFAGFNIGIGECSGNLIFERNSFSPSSSFLKMTNLHKTEFSFTNESKPVSVKIERLDSIAEKFIINEPLLIKIDTQGYEERVLRGGEQTIKRAKLIIIETSFEYLYEGQPLFNDVYQQMINYGFVYMGALTQLCSSQSGQVLQADSIFVKKCANEVIKQLN